MTVVFATNYFNHHQSCLARELDRLTDHHFFFLETMPMDDERRALGWKSDSQPDYVIRSYEPNQAKRCRELIRDADAVIWGSCPFSMILPRLLAGKLTFLYSERIFKEGKSGFGFWGRGVKYLLKLGLFQRNHYLLASSAYAAADYNLLGLFRGRSYRWGYFPEVLAYDPDALILAKQPNSLLWVGRMIPYKHPEAAIETARRLKQEGAVLVFDTGWLDDLSIENYREYIELADYYTPNQKEALKITGADTPARAAEILSDYFENVIVKLDKDGCLIRENGREHVIPNIPEFAHQDSTGAGDAFLAGLLYGLYHDYSFRESVLFGNITGGKCVTAVGCLTAYCTEPELLTLAEKYRGFLA